MARTDPDILKQVRARVAAGAAYLDVVKPGWHNKIDVERLNLASCHQCVIGQLVGEYIVAAVGLSTNADAAVLGFYVTPDDREKGIYYDALTRRWAKVIKARQAA